MSITIARATDGNVTGKYGVLEPNHLSAPRNGQVYAQLPVDPNVFTVLENGTFVKYDYAAGVVSNAGNGPWYMVFNEEKLYDERKQSHRDYAMTAENSNMVPRVFAVHAGDIFTTNTVADGTYAVGTTLAPAAATGILAANNSGTFQVVAETTLPDGVTPAVKIQVIG